MVRLGYILVIMSDGEIEFCVDVERGLRNPESTAKPVPVSIAASAEALGAGRNTRWEAFRILSILEC